ncbi:fatty acyl-CoA reductase wat-like [Anopheles maculipalpis]|uniref:fatty acyl-CoA reductase wat-like n=1 Tax=Anopheles maculipalpis TaxID=1496333 RepID=UPI00215969AF|nr:fatty acyl-CoA reductase wat-like [Anopheles maculipalpis]
MGDLSVVNEPPGANDVREFYQDSTIMLTGGTGFIGKVLLEKLLRCFEVKTVFLLIRERRNKTAAERLEEVFEDVIFDTIKASPNGGKTLLAKVVPIEVNFQSDVVISPADHHRLLAAQVEIVFNVMASVKFNEDIETAIDTNVLSSRKLFLLAQQLPHIRSIIHVSTFYSNCHRSHIEERIYEDLPFGGFENILGLFRHLTPEEKDRLKPIILGPMPNSYTFSKRCAEVMIQQQFGQLPIAIFRPPIVTSAYREPTPGWVNNFNGPAGMVVPVIRGQIYWCYGMADATVHMVPVDYCVNALLAVGWDNSQRKRLGNPITGEIVPVYNYAFQENVFQNRDVGTLLALGINSTLGRIFGRYTIHITSSTFMRKLFIHWLLLQACVVDICNKFFGKKAKNFETIKRVVALEDSTSYFRCHSWTTENRNIRTLWDRLTAEERQLLPFDVETLDWKDYFRFFVNGVAAALNRHSLARQRMQKH